jgi:DNA adenine methylase
MDTEVLWEPFCGSAAVSLAAAVDPRLRLRAIRLNDANEPLARLWQAILADPAAVAAVYEHHWNEQQVGDPRSYYDTIRDRFNETHEPELLLYLLARCVKAAVRYNAAGEFNQSPDNRRLGSRPERMREHLKLAAERFGGRATVTHDDYVQAVEAAETGDVIYMDPPYQGVSTQRDRRYRDTLGFDAFVMALEGFNQRSLSYIVSYDGRTGDKEHGRVLPESLRLVRLEVHAGRSSQATMLGRRDETVESLYLSESLMDRLGGVPTEFDHSPPAQQSLI